MQVKRIISVCMFVVIGFTVFAQKQRVNNLTTFDDKLIHFGFTLGLNTLDFGVAHYHELKDNPDYIETVPGDFFPNEKVIEGSSKVRADVAGLIPGFTVGIISSVRMNRDMELRFQPGLSFGERQLTYNVDVVQTGVSAATQFYSIKSTFLDFPLLIKYKARRINNDRPYVIFGPAFRYNINRSSSEDLVILENGSFYAEVGAGWDHYFTFFRFSVEAKVSFGLNNQIGPPPETQRPYYSQAISRLRSNIFTLSFHFE